MNYYTEIKYLIMRYIQRSNIIQRKTQLITFEIGKLLDESGSKYGDNAIDEYSKRLLSEVGRKYILEYCSDGRILTTGFF